MTAATVPLKTFRGSMLDLGSSYDCTDEQITEKSMQCQNLADLHRYVGFDVKSAALSEAM